jgi:very-short-patch-repair endonuclease
MDAPALIRATANAQDGVIAARQCRHLGMSPEYVKTLCRRGHWHRLFRGAYLVDADLRPPPARAVIRAGLLSAGQRAVAVLDSAAAIHGIGGLATPDGTVHVNLPGDGARAKRLVDRTLALHQLTIDPADVCVVDGMRVTTPLRTVADLILRTGRYQAVSVLDSALHQDLIGDDAIATLPGLIAGRRGAVRARRWITEADSRAASPLETRVRLRCVDGRVAPDVLQHPVYRQGRLLGIADLAWLPARLLAEADGVGVHDRPDAVFRDRWRQNELANAGWTILRFTWEDTFRTGYIAHVVRAALGRAVSS